jgi:hypothetical protein
MSMRNRTTNFSPTGLLLELPAISGEAARCPMCISQRTALLKAAKATADGARVSQGSRTDLSEHPAAGRKLAEGSNNASHLLRRLSRVSPETLAAYQNGAYTSVRAAARVAGIVRDRTALDALNATRFANRSVPFVFTHREEKALA